MMKNIVHGNLLKNGYMKLSLSMKSMIKGMHEFCDVK